MAFFNRQVFGRTLSMLATTVAILSATASAQQKGTFTDKRDGKAYKTAVIDGKKWMAENMSVKTGTSWCYGDDESNCKKYGRLYAWSTAAKMACPDGWHLPTRDEWGALAKAAGGTGAYGDGGGAAGKKLKSASGWVERNGTDSYGFSALPAGFRFPDPEGAFERLGSYSFWWSVTQTADGKAYHRGLSSAANDFTEYAEKEKDRGYSVRCVEGEPTESVIDVKRGSAAARQIGTFTDKRDGRKYKTAVIGGKTWMAENLNYESSCPEGDESICMQWCYGDDKSNCGKYGLLYNWHTARAVCPKGWRLPSREEWDGLVKAADGDGKALKSVLGWNENGGGTDDFGFSALPGGGRNADGSFNHVGKFGYWWTAAEGGGGGAYGRYISYAKDDVSEGYSDRGLGFSVRCLRD